MGFTMAINIKPKALKIVYPVCQIELCVNLIIGVCGTVISVKSN